MRPLARSAGRVTRHTLEDPDMTTRTEARSRARLALGGAGPEELAADFARTIARGFAASPRAVPFHALLDAAGVRLLRELAELPEHYVVQAERQTLAERADAAALYFPRGTPTVIEHGVVDVERTSQLLAPLVRHFGTLPYVAVGPHPEAIEPACRRLAAAHPGLQARGVVGRIEDAVRELRATPGPRLLFWPGGGAGGYERSDAIAVLRGIGAALGGSDLLIAGIDLRKDPRAIERASNDRKGVTRALRLNLVARINRELGGNLDPDLFRERIAYDPETGRLDAHVISRRAQTARIEALDLDVSFAKGEAIRVETATKFSPQEIDAAAEAASLVVLERWYDRDGRVAVNLMRLRGR